jgi:hypothetical protein
VETLRPLRKAPEMEGRTRPGWGAAVPMLYRALIAGLARRESMPPAAWGLRPVQIVAARVAMWGTGVVRNLRGVGSSLVLPTCGGWGLIVGEKAREQRRLGKVG